MRLLAILAVLEAFSIAQALPTREPRPWKPNGLTEVPGPLSPRDENPQSLETAAQLGGFSRFEWVTGFIQSGDRLARSSAPYYKNADHDQKLTPQSIEFLKQQNIKHVISLNSEANDPFIKEILRKNNIAYTPLPVKDFTPPTIEDLKKGYKAFSDHRSGTLVWCGYGHGRTGTMITALQVYSEHENPSPKKLSPSDYTKNYVETAEQIRLLNKLQRSLQPGLFQQTAQRVVQGVNAVEDALRRVLRNNRVKPKQTTQQPKTLEPTTKPRVKAPKFVGDVWPDQTPHKPSKQVFKQFDLGMAPHHLVEPSKVLSRVNSPPPTSGRVVITPKKPLS